MINQFKSNEYRVKPKRKAKKLFNIVQHIEIVTLIPRFPLSAKSCAIVVSKTRQSEFIMADETPAKKQKLLNVSKEEQIALKILIEN